MILKQIMLLSSGASIGVVLRYLVGVMFKSAAFPMATLVVNLVGCFMIGFIWGVFNNSISEDVKLFLMVGFLGAFTTFSAYGLDIVNLLNQQNLKSFIIYFFISNVMGVLLIYLGSYLGKEVKIFF